MAETATSARGRMHASFETREALLQESRSALDLLARAVSYLEGLGGAGEIGSLLERLRRDLEIDEVVVELTGLGPDEALEALLGTPVLAEQMPIGVALWVRGGPEPDFEARWSDGRRERAPADQTAFLEHRVAEIERSIAECSEEATRLAEELQDAARSATYARAQLAVVKHDLTAMQKEPEAALRKPSWLDGLRGWLRARFAHKKEPVPAPPPPAPVTDDESAHTVPIEQETLVASSPRGMEVLEQRVNEEVAQLEPAMEAVGELEKALREHKLQLAALLLDRAERRRGLEFHQEERQRQLVTRIRELATGGKNAPSALDISAPRVPRGVAVLLAPPGEWSARPAIRVDGRAAGADLLAQLEAMRFERPAVIARFAIAALCVCRNHIRDLERRTEKVHEERLGELVACRVDVEARRKRELAHAHLPVARCAEKVMQEAAARLEKLLAEVRKAWEDRIASCAGIEQMRAEVAAIENGAAYRLSLVCDEVRESTTVQSVRMVLELTRPLRQELLQKRLEVARGGSPRLEETFEDVRVALPESMEKTFGALRTPSVGELMGGERGLFDSLFRMLDREKRQCTARLRARLDDIEHTTVRELFAAAVYLSPTLAGTFGGLIQELLTAHERWIGAKIDEERLAYEGERARQGPALGLVTLLDEQEEKIGRLLESSVVT